MDVSQAVRVYSVLRVKLARDHMQGLRSIPRHTNPSATNFSERVWPDLFPDQDVAELRLFL